MTTVLRSGDCGNSPKNIFLENLTVAFATGEDGLLLEGTSADICWNNPGKKRIEGKSAFAAALERLKDDPVAEIRIKHVISHGKAGAVNGILKLDSGQTRAFCHVYEFSSAKGTSVREITSYVIEVSD